MQNLRRTITFLMWPMVILLPLWITLGRALFGSGGWVTFMYIFTGVPVLVISLMVINLIIRFNSTYKFEHLVTIPQAIILALLYCSVFLHGVFVVDGGDTADSLGSVATRILGNGFMDISNELGMISQFASVILLVVAFVVALGGLFRSRKV